VLFIGKTRSKFLRITYQSLSIWIIY